MLSIIEGVLFWRWATWLDHSVNQIESSTGATLVLHNRDIGIHPRMRHLEGTSVPMLVNYPFMSVHVSVARTSVL